MRVALLPPSYYAPSFSRGTGPPPAHRMPGQLGRDWRVLRPQAPPRSAWMLTQAPLGDTRVCRAHLSPRPSKGRRGRRGHPFGRGSRRRPSPHRSPCGRRQGFRSGLGRSRSSVDGFRSDVAGGGASAESAPDAILAGDGGTVVGVAAGASEQTRTLNNRPAASAASVVQRARHHFGGRVGDPGCVCAPT